MYNLVFSDGTGQRGVRKDGSSTNVHKLYVAARRVGGQTCFYDAGVGADPEKSQGIVRWLGNQAAKATGLGITKNIRNCYDFLFGRNSRTVRSPCSVSVAAPTRCAVSAGRWYCAAFRLPIRAASI